MIVKNHSFLLLLGFLFIHFRLSYLRALPECNKYKACPECVATKQCFFHEKFDNSFVCAHKKSQINSVLKSKSSLDCEQHGSYTSTTTTEPPTVISKTPCATGNFFTTKILCLTLFI